MNEISEECWRIYSTNLVFIVPVDMTILKLSVDAIINDRLFKDLDI